MDTGLWLDFLGIRLVSDKATGKEFKVNLNTPDNGEKYLIELSNSTLSNIEGYEAEDANLDITINRSDLDLVMMGVKSMDEMIADGTAKVSGDKTIIDQLKSMMIHLTCVLKYCQALFLLGISSTTEIPSSRICQQSLARSNVYCLHEQLIQGGERNVCQHCKGHKNALYTSVVCNLKTIMIN